MVRHSHLRVVAGLAALLLLPGLCSRATAITITEINYHPAGDRQDLEYIELHNETRDPFDLTGFFFSRGITFTFTDRLILRGGEYIVLCANEGAVRSAYGIENTIGNWNPATALDNGGEVIELSNSQGVMQTRVSYNDRGKWPGGADGAGHTLEIVDVWGEQDDPDNWRLSAVMGGSPGRPNDTETGRMPVFVNEAFLFTAAENQFFELYNDSLEEIDLSGFHVTSDRDNLTAFELPAGTTIGPRDFLAFGFADVGLPVVPDEDGRVFVGLTNPAADRVIDARVFEPRVQGFSEARFPDGSRSFQDAADPTRGAANEVSASDAIVINEFFYNALDNNSDREFLELYNRSDAAVDVGDWAFDDGINFRIPQGTVIPAGEFLVIARNPEFIRQTYGLSESVVVGPETDQALEEMGFLANGGERLTLVDQLGREVDSVRYFDGGEWPEWADGLGASLELIDANQDNSVSAAWDASDDSAEAETVEISYEGRYYNPGEQEFHLVLNERGIMQFDDLRMFSRETTLEPIETFFDLGAEWLFFRGVAPPSDPIEAWRQPDFDDASWETGVAPIGYSRRQDDGTILEGMEDNYSAVFFRKAVDLGDVSRFTNLILQVDYDDGFVAYINGQEIHSVNMDDGAAWDATASRSARTTLEEINLNELIGTVVQPGVNTFAIQVHNTTIGSNDFRFDARLLDGQFVNTDGPNLIRDGDFENENDRGTPRWPAGDTNTFWVYEGTHVRSGRSTTDPLSGTASLKIVASSRGDNKVNRIETTNAGLTGLANGGNYNIQFKARWVVGTQTLLTHGAYNNPASAPNYADSHQIPIPETLGTPGAINSVTERLIGRTGGSNQGPVVSKVEHEPAVPGADVPVTVTAHVADPDGIAEVVLLFTIDTPKFRGDAGVQEIAMTDPDGDGEYEASIPPQAARRPVIFWIETLDQAGQPERFPVNDLERTHALTLDPENPEAADLRYFVYRHDTQTSPAEISYRFWMDRQTEAFLSTRRLLSNDLVNGTFVFNSDEVYHHARARFSGSPWARQGRAGSYRVNLPKDKQLKGSIKKFNMEDHQGGGGRDGRERMSHYMIRFTGGIYSDQWLVRFQANDLVNDVREHMQTPNRELLTQWFPDDDEGPFFEMDDRFNINDAGSRQNQADGKLLYPPYNSPTGGEDKENYRYFFGSRGGNPTDDFSDLIAFAKIMAPNITRDPEFDEVIWDVADVEEMLGVWAIRMNTDDWDTWGTDRGKNAYLYLPETLGLWQLLPWDMELTYGNAGRFMPPRLTASSTTAVYRPTGDFPEVIRFTNRPSIKRLFYGIMNHMIRPDGPFTREFLIPFAQELQRARVNPGNVVSFVASRRNSLLNVTRGVTSEFVDFEITTNNGEPMLITEPTVTIEGRAPIEARWIRVLVNGEEPSDDARASFSDSDALGFGATLQLSGGVNDVTFIAYDFNEDELASTSVQVTVESNEFIRGDANLSGRIDITDAVRILMHIGQGYIPPCEDALDVDDSGSVEITDAIRVITYLFLRGDAPPPPYPGRGEDPTSDSLGCETGL